jgi:signal peptidase I
MKGQYKAESELIAASKSKARDIVWGKYVIKTRPVDKRENYIKRCVGIAGDSIRILNDEVYINGVKSPIPPQSQVRYLVTLNSAPDYDIMKEEYNLNEDKGDYESIPGKPGVYKILLTNEAKEKMQKNGLIKSIALDYDYGFFPGQDRSVYPYDTVHHWNREDFGPVWIPKKGVTITLTPENFALYQRVIQVYENNKLEQRSGKTYINDKETNQYTFKMDYYWMMGDNRMDSQDSRFWGFVPEDHVVGEAGMIWMSWEGGVRWKRLFNIIR